MAEIRPIRQEDAEAVAGVHTRSWQKAYRGMVPEEYLQSEAFRQNRRQLWQRIAGSGEERQFLLEEAGTVQGFVTLREPKDGVYGELQSCYLDPCAWGQGKGRLLLDFAQGYARQQGWGGLELWVLEKNQRARKVYQAAGFGATGEKKTETIGGAPLQELRYRWVAAIQQEATEIMDPSIYEKRVLVEQDQCDCVNRQKASALLAQVQQVSIDQCDAIGMNQEAYARTHTAFLLAKVSVEWKRTIQVGEALTLRTQPSYPVRAVYDRRTQLLDAQGEEAAQVDAKWVLVDTQSRKILREPPEELAYPFHNEAPDKGHDLSLPKGLAVELTARETVTYSRTDCNGHLNNARYADLIWDLLPVELVCQKHPEKLVIHYHSEAMLGQQLQLGYAQTPDGSYYVVGKKEDGTKCFEALVRFAE